MFLKTKLLFSFLLAAVLPALTVGTAVNPIILATRKVTTPIGFVVSKAFSIPNKIIFHSFLGSDLPKNYESLSAKEKINLLWGKCIEDRTTVGHTPNSKALPVFFRDMNDVFDHCSDERPWRGNKPIHGSGYICKAKFVASPSEYTGLFKGCDNLIIRSAPGLPPTKMLLSGVSIKFLRDKVHSGNVLALRKIGTNKDNFNWFDGMKSMLASPITPPIGILLGMKFRTAKTSFDTDLSISDMSDYDQKGMKESNPMFPHEVILKPGTSKFENLRFEEFENIKAGSKLYDVFAKKTEASPEVLIGSITTTSEQTLSRWGDKKLFFQHQRREDDLNRIKKMNKQAKIKGGASGCPFAH